MSAVEANENDGQQDVVAFQLDEPWKEVLEIVHIPGRGRGLRALQRIPAGQMVFRELPFVSSLAK